MESLNRMSIELVDEALDFAEELDIGAYELDNGATVLDFGVDFDGGIEAGLLLTEIQTAGLATVQSRIDSVAGVTLPHIELSTDHPALALLCSQKAGWEISVDGYEALGSGPARALVAQETEFQELDYVDIFDLTVLALESDTLPSDSVAEHVANLADVDTSGVFLPTFPTASVAGGVSLAARAPELALFRLFELGYDPSDVITASGTAPLPPIPADEDIAIARANDALAYGGKAHLVVREDFDQFSEVPSSATNEYGRPFEQILEEADWDFYAIDDDVFAPADITIDVVGGPTYSFGEPNESILQESFEL
ncbi:methenyltetrahydromethanopterin cyclohydrolase [Salinarchaeum sp. IM2453]|uniref:methenyltetrahydromethanopterin cyclohydrolase n=1 Tax=Salinarchaeum sp. IM2453 TaxID=2862870 RepID=UPI001C83C6B8|nr:methenyltetrahydromethanopterin cyclohydrolase [Salinarchaeum sp. IM2453]QZA87719.1 methenyltetrahydromethanopterin cyclohydrolase [Salinarchaeum sp. IM2453]